MFTSLLLLHILVVPLNATSCTAAVPEVVPLTD
jgi:hypothetical protein